MATPQQIYAEWRSSLKSPDDSLFYYHPDLERILLGLSIYAISSRQLVKDLGKAESLSLLNIYITDLITAWIDEDDDAFKTMFDMTMTVAEAYIPCLMAAEEKYPSKKRQIRKLGMLYGNAVSVGGDMSPGLAETLLDDLSTDGKQIYSDKIKKFGDDLLSLIRLHGMDIPPSSLNRLNGW
ncbi:MAG: hypothetical protein K1W02_13870 [Muribaculaceae bacterium]